MSSAHKKEVHVVEKKTVLKEQQLRCSLVLRMVLGNQLSSAAGLD